MYLPTLVLFNHYTVPDGVPLTRGIYTQSKSRLTRIEPGGPPNHSGHRRGECLNDPVGRQRGLRGIDYEDGPSEGHALASRLISHGFATRKLERTGNPGHISPTG